MPKAYFDKGNIEESILTISIEQIHCEKMVIAMIIYLTLIWLLYSLVVYVKGMSFFMNYGTRENVYTYIVCINEYWTTLVIWATYLQERSVFN